MIYSPSLEILFPKEVTFCQRMKAVKELGFTAFEFWGWENKDLNEISEMKEALELNVASFCTKGAPLVDPANHSAFMEGLAQSLEVANKLSCSFLIVTTGNERTGVSREEQQQSIIEGLRASVPLLNKSGVTLIVEPLNTLVDHKGYYLNTTEEAVHIIKEVGSSKVKVLYDIYHQQITEGNLIANITNHYDKIGYYHLADHPGRHEPGTGEINYINVLSTIKQLGYKGYMGLEYRPAKTSSDSLRQFMREYA